MRLALALALAALALLVPHPAQSADTGAAWVGHETVADEATDGDAALTMGADGLVIAWTRDTTPPRATAWRHVEGARGVARAGEGWVVFTLDERVVLDASLGELERTPLSAWLRCAGTPAAWSWDETAGVVTLDHPAGTSSEGAPRLPTEEAECRVAFDGAALAWADADGRYTTERRGADWAHRSEAPGDTPVWPAGLDTRRGPRCAWSEDSGAPCVDRSGLGLLPRALEPALGWSDGRRWVAATHGGWLAHDDEGARWFTLAHADAVLSDGTRASVLGCHEGGVVVHDAFTGRLLSRIEGRCPDTWWPRDGGAIGVLAGERFIAEIDRVRTEDAPKALLAELGPLGPGGLRVRASIAYSAACGGQIVRVEVEHAGAVRAWDGGCDAAAAPELLWGAAGLPTGIRVGDTARRFDGRASESELTPLCEVSAWPAEREVRIEGCATLRVGNAEIGMTERGAWLTDGGAFWANEALAAAWIIPWRGANVHALDVVATSAWERARRALGRLE